MATFIKDKADFAISVEATSLIDETCFLTVRLLGVSKLLLLTTGLKKEAEV